MLATGGDREGRIECLRQGHPDRHAALKLISGAPRQPGDRVRQNLDTLKNAVVAQGLMLDPVYAVKRGGRVAATVAAVMSPGRAAMVLHGPTRTGDLPPGVGVALLEALKNDLRQRDVALLQALLTPHDAQAAHIYRDAGFRFLAELVYQELVIASKASDPRPQANLTYLAYSRELEPRFVDVLNQTYLQSLDCPELTGLRDTSDVLLGHRHSGVGNPEDLWYLAMRDDSCVGVLLLAGVAHRPCLEVVYMGVVPSERGRGVGDSLLSLAVDVARRRHARALTLAVDHTNAPARRLYQRAGFVETARRRAWICASPF